MRCAYLLIFDETPSVTVETPALQDSGPIATYSDCSANFVLEVGFSENLSLCQQSRLLEDRYNCDQPNLVPGSSQPNGSRKPCDASGYNSN